MLTFIILGLWHGPNWTYVVFGAFHGLMLSLEFFTKKIRKRIRQQIPVLINDGLGILFTFLYFSVSLIFFRANSVSDALYFVGHLFSGISNIFDLPTLKASLKIGLELYDYIIVLLAIILMQYVENKQLIINISTFPRWKRWSIYYLFLLVTFLFAVYGSSQFIYFQF
jgi:D-alanyl-lipoteichoic acid acyltransferase DltB (MBOAT superfamily)